MVKVCINGGSLAGLVTSLLLGADGHDVTVAERDPAPPSRDPEVVWGDWERRSVRQIRQTHAFLPRFRHIVAGELPHVWTRLLEAGIVEHDLVGNPPETITDRAVRPGDEELVLLMGRRPTVESVLHHAAADDPRIRLLPGVRTKGLLTDAAGTRATGLATSAGPVEADVVVDCGGPRSAVSDWVEEAVGVRPDEKEAEYRIAYWTQWFRARDGREAPSLSGLPATNMGPFTLLRCPADHAWFSVTVVAPASAKRFRVLSDQDRLLGFLRRLDATAGWADPAVAEPVGDILPMFTPVDSRRRFVTDGRPCIGGLTGAGDAIGATNPTVARGTTFAAMHAVGLRDVLRSKEDPTQVTLAHDAHLQAEFEPWWEATVAGDRANLAAMQATAEGAEAPPDPASMFRHAAQHDADLWRQLLRIAGVLDLPQDVVARPGVLERVAEALDRAGPPPDIDVDRLLGADPT